MKQLSKISTAAKSRAAAFSIKEMLSVVAVISVLLCVQLSALTGGANSAKIAQCAANLKQFVGMLQLYGDANNGLIPTITGGNWPWDIAATSDNALATYGRTRQSMYCPGFPEQNIDQMWNYSVLYNNTTGVAISGYRTIGYATTLSSGARVFADDVNASLTTQKYALNGSDPSIGPAGTTVYIPPSRRVLLADATTSYGGQTNPAMAATYQWTLHTDIGVLGTAVWNNTPYGPWKGSSTPHMGALTPLGGNLAMLDGHVQWRPFTNMLVRTGGAGDAFWW